MQERIEAWANALIERPWIAHILRATTRFGNRLGSQFAAAITYFSVLSLVPILMFAFSILGMTLTVLRPDLLDRVTAQVAKALGTGQESDQIRTLIEGYLHNWRAVGIVGLISALYAGSAWVGNLTRAVRAQWRPAFENVVHRRNLILRLLWDVAVLVILLASIATVIAANTAGGSLLNQVSSWLHLDQVTGGRVLVRLMSWATTIALAWVLFMIIYRLLPRPVAPFGARAWGSLWAAIALWLLQLGAGLLIQVFNRNRATSLFGPVIVLMLVLNLFAQLILLMASWIATSNQPAIAYTWNKFDEPLRNDPDAIVVPGHWQQADANRAAADTPGVDTDTHGATGDSHGSAGAATDSAPRARSGSNAADHPTHGGSEQRRGSHRGHRDPSAATKRPAGPPRPTPPDFADAPHPDPAVMVSQDVAARSVRAGATTGWLVGAATGLGLGALVGQVLGRMRRR